MTAKSFLMKLVAAHNYKPTGKINANTLLIKPTENYAKLQNDYGLSQVNTQIQVSKYSVN
jgi:fatty acid synthase, animal type